MSEVTLTVKRVKRGVLHVIYTDGGLEGRTLRLVVRGGDLPKGKETPIKVLHDLLLSIPEGSGVYAVYDGPLGAATFTATTRIHPETAATVISVVGLLLRHCQACSPHKARTLIRRFNSAVYQVLRNNFPPMRRLIKTLKTVPTS